MALSRVTTWTAGQVLTAAALNAEFDNILNNALTLISPLTATLAAGGNIITGLGLGTVSSPTLQFTGDTNTGIWSAAGDRLNFSTGGVARMEILAGGIVYIGATATPANSFSTVGLVIDQAASDNEILTFRSSDVAHGITSETTTDSYGTVSKLGAAVGGLFISGWSETTGGFQVNGVHTTDDATHSTAGSGALIMAGYIKSGTTVAALGATQNIMVIRSASTTRFIFDSDGNSYQDVGTAWTNFDEQDDVALLDLLSAHVTRQEDPLRATFGQWLSENRDALEEHQLVTFNDDGHHFLNTSRLAMLHTGAIRQLGHKLERCERALTSAGLLALP